MLERTQLFTSFPEIESAVGGEEVDDDAVSLSLPPSPLRTFLFETDDCDRRSGVSKSNWTVSHLTLCRTITAKTTPYRTYLYSFEP
jgi:hypothetical protein